LKVTNEVLQGVDIFCFSVLLLLLA